MNTLFRIAALAALMTHALARAGEVIAHPSVSLDADEIREVFLGEKQFAGNLKLVPIDNSGAQAEFLNRVLQTDARTYAARWTKKSFREGLAAPDVRGSDAEIAAFVRATPGAVGYVSGKVAGAKVLHKF
jgi:ABC-type phosphate transport system substrate-binding protein